MSAIYSSNFLNQFDAICKDDNVPEGVKTYDEKKGPLSKDEINRQQVVTGRLGNMKVVAISRLDKPAGPNDVHSASGAAPKSSQFKGSVSLRRKLIREALVEMQELTADDVKNDVNDKKRVNEKLQEFLKKKGSTLNRSFKYLIEDELASEGRLKSLDDLNSDSRVKANKKGDKKNVDLSDWCIPDTPLTKYTISKVMSEVYVAKLLLNAKKFAESKTVKTGGNKSVENKSVENKSVEKKNVENKSVGNKSVENKSGEKKSVEKKNVENKSVGNKSVENKSVGNKSVENKSVGNKSVENKSVGNKSVENKNVEVGAKKPVVTRASKLLASIPVQEVKQRPYTGNAFKKAIEKTKPYSKIAATLNCLSIGSTWSEIQESEDQGLNKPKFTSEPKIRNAANKDSVIQYGQKKSDKDRLETGLKLLFGRMKNAFGYFLALFQVHHQLEDLTSQKGGPRKALIMKCIEVMAKKTDNTRFTKGDEDLALRMANDEKKEAGELLTALAWLQKHRKADFNAWRNFLENDKDLGPKLVTGSKDDDLKIFDLLKEIAMNHKEKIVASKIPSLWEDIVSPLDKNEEIKSYRKSIKSSPVVTREAYYANVVDEGKHIDERKLVLDGNLMSLREYNSQLARVNTRDFKVEQYATDKKGRYVKKTISREEDEKLLYREIKRQLALRKMGLEEDEDENGVIHLRKTQKAKPQPVSENTDPPEMKSKPSGERVNLEKDFVEVIEEELKF